MIFLVGYMGAGKSTIAKLLAEKMTIDYCDTDSDIESNLNLKIHDIFNLHGKKYFRNLERDLIIKNKKKIVACGGGLPVYLNNMDTINKLGTTIYLKTCLEDLFNRLRNTHNRPLLLKIENSDLKNYIQKDLEYRKAIYEKAHYIIDTKNKDVSRVLAEVYSLVRTL